MMSQRYLADSHNDRIAKNSEIERGVEHQAEEQSSSSALPSSYSTIANREQRRDQPDESLIEYEIKHMSQIPQIELGFSVKAKRKKSSSIVKLGKRRHRNEDPFIHKNSKLSESGMKSCCNTQDNYNKARKEETDEVNENYMMIKNEYYDPGEVVVSTPKQSKCTDTILSKKDKSSSLSKKYSNIFLYHDAEKYDKILGKELHSRRKQMK